MNRHIFMKKRILGFSNFHAQVQVLGVFISLHNIAQQKDNKSNSRKKKKKKKTINAPY